MELCKGLIVSGGMLAVLGMEIEVIEQLCAEIAQQTGLVIEVANDNCPGQVVIAGDRRALGLFADECESRGQIPPKMLKVSVAPHTSLMKAALPEFLSVLSAKAIRSPNILVPGNVSVKWLTTADSVRHELAEQLTHGVRWNESMRLIADIPVDTMVEMAPGKTLTGLMLFINRAIKCLDFGDDPTQLRMW